MDINGASAVVTGGASGIGAAVARQLAAKGARVVIADLQAEKGEALAKEIGGVFVTVDVTNWDGESANIEDAVFTFHGERKESADLAEAGAAATE